MQFHLLFGWVWIALGFLSGALIGLFFHRPGWLGGYEAWPRRLVRLGHISLVALGLVHIALAASFPHLGIPEEGDRVLSGLFVVGAVAMPATCFVTAYFPGLKNLFAIPVIALVTGVLLVIWRLSTP